MTPYINPLMERLVPVLLSPKAAKSLVENSAVTIGRLGFVCPAQVAPHLDLFMRHWCTALAEIKDNDEKDSAFKGICMVIQANPNGVVKVLGFFRLSLVSNGPPELPILSQRHRAVAEAFPRAQPDVPKRACRRVSAAMWLTSKCLQILTGFKQMLGEQWAPLMASMPQPIQVRITERYHV
jgi:transportin-1